MKNYNHKPGEGDYQVVVNHEDQHSIWPVEKTIPTGWEADGFKGSKSDCLRHIAEVWTDITPKSVRVINKG